MSADKAALLNDLHKAWSALAQLIGSVSDAQLEQAKVMDSWSIKDIMAHITFWEQRSLAILDAVAHQQSPSSLFLEPFDLDAVNEQAYIESRQLTLEQVKQQFYHTHQAIVARIEPFSDAQLTMPQEWPWSSGIPLWQHIEGDTTEHYLEHADHIRAWLNRAE